MNKDRRKRIDKLLAKLDMIRSDFDDDARDELEALGTEERDAFDNMPEGVQRSERGETASEAADELDAALEDFDAGRCGLDECISRLSALT